MAILFETSICLLALTCTAVLIAVLSGLRGRLMLWTVPAALLWFWFMVGSGALILVRLY